MLVGKASLKIGLIYCVFITSPLLGAITCAHAIAQMGNYQYRYLSMAATTRVRLYRSQAKDFLRDMLKTLPEEREGVDFIDRLREKKTRVEWIDSAKWDEAQQGLLAENIEGLQDIISRPEGRGQPWTNYPMLLQGENDIRAYLSGLTTEMSDTNQNQLTRTAIGVGVFIAFWPAGVAYFGSPLYITYVDIGGFQRKVLGRMQADSEGDPPVLNLLFTLKTKNELVLSNLLYAEWNGQPTLFTLTASCRLGALSDTEEEPAKPFWSRPWFGLRGSKSVPDEGP